MVASLRSVIAKQAAEIEALQSKLKELTTTPQATAAPTTSDAPQPTEKFAEVRYVFFSRLLLSFPSRYLGGCGDEPYRE